MDLITFMMEADPFGHLLIGGVPPSNELIARLICSPALHVKRAIAELETNQVFSRTDKDVIYSRRMVRDSEKSAHGRESAGKRWSNGHDDEPIGSPIGFPNRRRNGIGNG